MYVKLLVFFTLPVAQNNWQYESTEGKAYKNKYDIWESGDSVDLQCLY